MRTNVLKGNLASKAACAALAGGLALAMVPAAPALAAEATGTGNAAATAAAAGAANSGAVTTWKDLYAGLGVNTATGYDAVTSATQFTGHHVKDIPTIVDQTTDANGAISGLDGVKDVNASTAGAIQTKLQKAEFNYNCSHGTGEFLIYPDDTVSGYTWNNYLNNTYAVTVSDGTTTVGALPWIDYYGENSTAGYHYNKMEVALNNGTSVGSNEANVTRFAKFYNADGTVKAGNYTVTIYSKGYTPLTATVKVLPTYTGAQVTASSKAANALAISNLPANIKDAKATVSYTTGHGRNAVTTYLAGTEEDGIDINKDGTVSLNAEALAAVDNGTELDVEVANSNYAPIYLKSTVADTAVFPNGMKATAKAKTVKAKKLKKAKQTVKAISVKNAQGKVSYQKAGGSKKLTVNKSNGKITVKKGTKKGTYSVKVKVTAAGNVNFAKATQTVTAKVKVK